MASKQVSIDEQARLKLNRKLHTRPVPEGYKRWSVQAPTLAGKKWSVLLITDEGKQKRINFGAAGMTDYTIHKDKEKRRKFRGRFAMLIEQTKDDPTSPMYYSAWLLW